VTPVGRQDQVKADLQASLKGVFCAVVDNSSGLTMLHVTGENAAALLETDCPLDLHPREFKAGQCAQTRLARAGMIVSPLADGAGFEVIIRRSFADYLLLWLQDAAIALE
jgi:sarcosine oxidase subunit gamma